MVSNIPLLNLFSIQYRLCTLKLNPNGSPTTVYSIFHQQLHRLELLQQMDLGTIGP